MAVAITWWPLFVMGFASKVMIRSGFGFAAGVGFAAVAMPRRQ